MDGGGGGWEVGGRDVSHNAHRFYTLGDPF